LNREMGNGDFPEWLEQIDGGGDGREKGWEGKRRGEGETIGEGNNYTY